MLTYYLDIDARGEDENFLIPMLIQGLHLAIVQECGNGLEARFQQVLAFDLPLARESLTGGCHGGILRVFGADENILGRFLRNPAINRFTRQIPVSVTQKIPQHSAQRALVRWRGMDRLSLSYKERQLRRGHVPNCVQKNRKMVEHVAVELRSHSSGATFSLRMAFRHCEAESFNSYGLGGALPVFES